MAKAPVSVVDEPAVEDTASEALAPIYRVFYPVTEGSNEMTLFAECSSLEALTLPDGPYQIETNFEGISQLVEEVS